MYFSYMEIGDRLQGNEPSYRFADKVMAFSSRFSGKGEWSMAEIIDNKSRLLGDDIKQEMKSGVKVNIVASVFTIEKYKQ